VENRLTKAEQAKAGGLWVEILDKVSPSALRAGEAYMISRGGDPEHIRATGGCRRLDRGDWYNISVAANAHPDADLLLAAGLMKLREGKRVAAWFDEVALGSCLSREGAPAFFWARRLYPERFLPNMKYQNQIVGQSRYIPFGMDAVLTASSQRGILRIVEGPITALGSRSLTDGHAAPTAAMLRRPGWERNPGPQEVMWTFLLEELRRCERVEICPDNDQEPAKLAVGVKMAGNMAYWMRLQGVRGVVRTFQHCPDLDDLPTSIRAESFGYPEKDFADVARRQRGERLVA
jgi:hypothetical protein